MKLLKILGIIILILGIVALLGVLLLPSDSHVDRSTTINASPAKVFSVVNNMKKSNEWSPWFDIDPNTEYSYEGPDAGVGAKMSWKSDHKDVGSGSQWIVESVPNEKVGLNLRFEGFEDDANAAISLSEEGEGTKVTWSFDSKMKGLYKFFGLMMDGMLGPQYEKGLASLKSYVEGLPEETYSVDISEVNTDGTTYLGIAHTVQKADMANLSATMGQLYGEIMGYMAQNKVESNDMPLAVYPRWEEDSFDMECGIPVAAGTEVSSDRITAKQIPAGKAVKAVHPGDYHKLEGTHWEIDKYIKANGLEIAGAPWEHYVTDPGEESDTTKWITHVYYPVK